MPAAGHLDPSPFVEMESPRFVDIPIHTFIDADLLEDALLIILIDVLVIR